MKLKLKSLEIEPDEDGNESATKREKRAPKSGQQSSGNDHDDINTQNVINSDVLSLFGFEAEYDHDGGEGEVENSGS